MNKRLIALAATVLATTSVHAGPATAAAAPQAAQSTAPAPAVVPPDVTVSGVVRDGALDGRVLWFNLNGFDLRFVVQTPLGADPQTILELLRTSAKAEAEIEVVFGAADAGVDFETAMPRVLVRRLSYLGRILDGVVASPPPPGEDPRSKALAAYAAGVIAMADQDPASALTWLTQAMDGDRLPPKLKVLALKTRARANDDLANDLPEGSDGDRLFLAAFHDFESWGAAEPDNADAAFAAAGALRNLGAYEEALVRYRKILVQWPRQDHWGSIRIAGTMRAMDRAGEALAVLDDYARRSGRQDGMPFHFHRARTLIELGRFDEAARMINVGLKAQPDYAWAFITRACALGQAGRPREALADARKARSLNAEVMSRYRPSRSIDHNTAWLAGVVAVLEKAAAQGTRTRSAAACDGDWAVEKRERSPLLPANGPIPDAPAPAV